MRQQEQTHQDSDRKVYRSPAFAVAVGLASAVATFIGTSHYYNKKLAEGDRELAQFINAYSNQDALNKSSGVSGKSLAGDLEIVTKGLIESRTDFRMLNERYSALSNNYYALSSGHSNVVSENQKLSYVNETLTSINDSLASSNTDLLKQVQSSSGASDKKADSSAQSRINRNLHELVSHSIYRNLPSLNLQKGILGKRAFSDITGSDYVPNNDGLMTLDNFKMLAETVSHNYSSTNVTSTDFEDLTCAIDGSPDFARYLESGTNGITIFDNLARFLTESVKGYAVTFDSEGRIVATGNNLLQKVQGVRK